MSPKVRTQLSVMMFLEFFVWGVWFVTMGTYLMATLKFSGVEVAAAYSTTNWAAFIAPFFIGMIADRFFSAQKLLGVMHLVGAAFLYYASTIPQAGPFFWVLLGYALLYMPTLALVNAISFHQMKDPGAQFPSVRVWGTIGWIVANVLVGYVLKPWRPDIESAAIPMQLGAAASVLMGLYSFSLPDTPPKSIGKKITARDVLGLDALALMKDRSFAILVISSLLISIPLAFYYNFTNMFLNETKGVPNPAASMSLGQVSEVVFMFLMAWFLRKLGIKKLMIIGMTAWTVRYLLFAQGAAGNLATLLYLGIILHGVCYDFFFVSGQIYVDRKAPKHLQASAQGFITLCTYGLGMLIGAWVSGLVIDAYAAPGGGHRWADMWYVPAAMAGAVTLLFAALFKDDVPATEPAGAAQPAGA